ncbi:uncharacterized protein LOC111296403 [Durio zibethinus]|uniref:Uncharacterized protein LOC111296403 n=1 Tax=Durio zibethinus TaxID=66656 RepID=A0A6P5Z285_DURZI|nr:uncharacterized protein LOC111296403 [Durio zibethinus]
MSTDSISTQLRLQELEDILGPDLTQFKILICQLISNDEDQVMLENLEEVVPKVLKSLNDTHPCVRLVAINAIRELSEELDPELQTQYHEISLITLVEVMNDFQSSKLKKGPAASAFVGFIDNGTQNIQDLYRKIVNDCCTMKKWRDRFQEQPLDDL